MKWFAQRIQKQQQEQHQYAAVVWFMWCQHDDAITLLEEYGITRSDLLRSWAYIEDGVVYRGSTAWLMAVRNLRRPYCYLHYLIYIPLLVREAVYGYIAQNRYRLLGKRTDGCERPNKDMMQRMLHSTYLSEEHDDKDDNHDYQQERNRKQTSLVIPKETRKRLLVIGCGPAGMMIAKKTRHVFDVLVVEPKDYFEFTPGILRGMCDPDQLKQLHCPLQTTLVDQLGICLLQGVVTTLKSRRATIQWQSPPTQQEHMDKLNRFLVNGRLNNDDDDKNNNNNPSVKEVEFDYCVVATGSAYITSPLWKVFPSQSSVAQNSHFYISNRVAQMTSEHERLFQLNGDEAKTTGEPKHRIVIVGAGLVGVELAAELCHHYPHLCKAITLYDLAPTILTTFPKTAQDYAAQWLTQKGVTITTDAKLEDIDAAKKVATVVYMCVGVKVTASSFMPASTIGEGGEIVVNEAMHVLVAADQVEMGLREKEVAAITTKGITAPPSTLFGSGRIFAVGDCVRVRGLPPFSKDTYPAETMAGIVVNNLIHSLNAHCTQDHHARTHMTCIHPLQQISLCSLGPHDCMLVVNGMYVSNGRLATFAKETIQYTKMSEARNELLGTSLWNVVPHL
jgi:NADH dehydrogenase FAD-containing subunit/predicted DCC family thiol-disulfide oxidoreductase YuxK